MDASAFPLWSLALLAAFGVALWLAFVFALVVALNALERLVGSRWPEARKSGISMFLAAALLTMVFSFGGSTKAWFERVQGDRRASQQQEQEATCVALNQPLLLGRPPSVIRAVEIEGAGWGIGKSITNPRQGLPRVSTETLVLHSRGRETPDMIIAYEGVPPAGVDAILPRGATLISNVRIQLRNERSGEIIAEQNLSTLRFKGQSKSRKCWQANSLDQSDYTGPTLSLLKIALQQR